MVGDNKILFFYCSDLLAYMCIKKIILCIYHFHSSLLFWNHLLSQVLIFTFLFIYESSTLSCHGVALDLLFKKLERVLLLEKFMAHL